MGRNWNLLIPCVFIFCLIFIKPFQRLWDHKENFLNSFVLKIMEEIGKNFQSNVVRKRTESLLIRNTFRKAVHSGKLTVSGNICCNIYYQTQFIASLVQLCLDWRTFFFDHRNYKQTCSQTTKFTIFPEFSSKHSQHILKAHCNWVQLFRVCSVCHFGLNEARRG